MTIYQVLKLSKVRGPEVTQILKKFRVQFTRLKSKRKVKRIKLAKQNVLTKFT